MNQIHGGGGVNVNVRRDTPDAPQSMGQIETIAREQAQLISLYAGSINELRGVVDKLLGPMPPQTKPGGDGSKAVGMIGMLHEQAQTLGEMQVILENLVMRLRTLA